jgi:hypothetical protein
LSATATGTYSAFLEHHYYNDGLRHRTYGVAGDRPTWAAPADWVGFRNEFAIGATDYAVELAKFRIAQDDALWLAIHVAAQDAEYGDRATYAGIGIWYRNAIVTSPGPLIESLQALLSAGMSIGHDVRAQAEEFLGTGYANRFVTYYDRLPEAFAGLSAASTPLSETELKEISGRSPNSDALLADALYSAQLLPTQEQASRLLIRLSSSDDSGNERAGAGTEQYTSVGFSRKIAVRIPIAVNEVNETLKQLNEKISTQDETCLGLRQSLERLQSDLKTEKAARSAAEIRAAEFEKVLNEDDDRSRFVQLFDAIQSVKRVTEDTANKNHEKNQILFSGLSNEFLAIARVEGKLESLLSAKNRPAQDFHPSRQANERTNSVFHPYVIAFVFAVILLVLAIGYFASRHRANDPVQEVGALGLTAPLPKDVIVIVGAGTNFTCTPTKLWDGDGPIW